jgi:PAS domain S-box-containing protein
VEKVGLYGGELHDSEMMMKGMIMADELPAMVWVSDAEGLRTYFNRSWLNFTGRSLPQELGNGWSDGIHPDDQQRCLDIYYSSIKSQFPFKIEYRLRRADGIFRWVLSHGEPRFSAQGELRGYIGSCVDIHEQKGSVETRSNLAAIVQSSDDAIVTKDLNGIIRSWNASAERIFGYTEEEVLGKPITILIPPELHAQEANILSRLKAGQRIEHFETERVAKGGEKVLVSLTVSPVKDASGRIVAASKVARDVTRAKQVEQALRDSEQRMRFCLEAASLGTWQWDLTSGKVRWSENMERIHGQRLGSFSGNFETFLEGISQEDRQNVRQCIQRALEGDGKYHVEYRQPKLDGSIAWMEAIGQVIYDESKRPAGMMGVCRDVSERKSSEEALNAARNQLEARVKERTSELNRAQEALRRLSGRLLSMQDDERRRIARELHDTAGQVLVALTLTLVPVEAELRRKDAELAKEISTSLGLIEELSRELRTMSHLLHPPLLDEAGLHSAVRWYVEGFAERSKIHVELHLDPSVGRLSAEMETAIFRIVQECLTNIHRHSGSDSASIVITREDRNVKIEIRDRGKGLPTPSPRPGIGIQGMRERVRQLSGKFEIQSDTNGTRVSAIFPAGVAALEPSAEALDVAS